MNKKLFLGMFAAVGMLFATSCSNDELDGVQSGNEATVSFTLGVEGGVQTRAISDGSGAKKLHYRVFNEDGTPVSNALAKKVETVDSYPYEVKLTLAKGQTYKVAFWAQNADCNAYKVDENMQLTIDYKGNNNDEKRDAFFKTETFTVTGNTNIDVVLKRPFAQINVGVTDEDWNAAIDSDINIQTSKIVIKNAAASMNLVDGSVDNETEVTYDFGATPKSTGETLNVGLDGDGTAESYNYLSMSYILVYDENGGAEKANLDEVEFTFKPTNTAKNDIVFNTGLNSVPVQRNWRTNIIGQILTGTIDFNITIDPIYDGEYNYFDAYPVELNGAYFKTIEDAVKAAKSGDVINLAAGSFNLPAKLHVGGTTTEADITFVGTGDNTVIHALTPSQTDRPSTYAENAGITFKNLKYETHNDWLRAGFAHAKYVNFESCTIEGGYHCFAPVETFKNCTFDPLNDFIVTYGSLNTTFEDCTFNSSLGNAIQAYSEGYDNDLYLTIKNCEFTAAQAGKDEWYNGPITAVEISSIRGNNFIVDITNTTATGYSTGTVSGNCLWNWRDNSADSNSKGTESAYVTVDGILVYPTPVTVDSPEALAEALAAAKMGANIKLEEGEYTIPANAKNKTLRFAGIGDVTKTVIKVQVANGDANNDNALAGSNVTFENLTIEPDNNNFRGFGHMNGTYKGCIIKNQYTLYGESLFERCAFQVEGDHYNVWTWGANATFNDCTFDCDGKAVLVYGPLTSTVTFNDCAFIDNNNDSEVSGKAAIETGNDYGVKYTININGCTVYGFDVNKQSGSNVWANKNSMSKDDLNIVIDGTEVY